MFIDASVDVIKHNQEGDLGITNKWLGNNRLHHNVSTTKYLLDDTHKRLIKASKVSVNLSDTQLEKVLYEYKYLGLLFDLPNSCPPFVCKNCQSVYSGE